MTSVELTILRVEPITATEHLRFIAARPSASFLQCPSWAAVKAEWKSESIGWRDTDGVLRGVGLVLYRRIPRLQRYLAYLPEGPVLDWESPHLADWLTPMVTHLASQRAFAIRMGPPVMSRSWEAATVKSGLADETPTRLGDLAADTVYPAAAAIAATLRSAGWQPPAQGEGFSAGQPQYVFQLPLAGRTLDDVFATFNQLWRRNVRKAEKSGVEVVQGDTSDWEIFHELYRVTALRDGFTPRPLAYFQTMWQAMRAEDPTRIHLYLARHGGETLAATTLVHVGDHAWYSYGASANHGREFRPSNAIQWQMIRDAHAAGSATYDLRGISDTLDSNHPLFGLIQFKLGTGGRAVEYLGEWDLPITGWLYRAFIAYLSRR
jgi:lipid II:glycine glycyltransferase (peptidoglycan interpeptide bridge formation enzyme)